ncbi:MAG: UDP-N-acetyl-D-glucosamine dehydrogenase [Anaerolineaceae bacterium 4572_5.1]|nr:MAG: UDP-N-acetyl-D-glucosamine dehydrogenase [Anaerolineaceae bacterium 4572_5.1]
MPHLSDKIKNKTAIVGVVGLGYVGLPLAIASGEIGFSVIGVDLSAEKVKQLNDGVSYIPDVNSATVRQLAQAGRFRAYSSFSPLQEADVIFICVPTPFDAQKAPDLSFIKSAVASIAQVLRPGQLIILQSTTYPGTTTEVVLPILNQSDLTVGEDFYLAFSPERIDPGQVGSSGFDVHNTPKVVGGVTPACTKKAAAFLSTITPEIHTVSSPAVAEMSKLLENTFRSVNIALVNELTLLSDRMGIDIWEVIDAAKTKPFGFMPFYPGPGVGGHCIPVDPYYLSWKAREFDFYTKFIELAAEVNSGMPYFTVEKITQALNESAKTLQDAKILILGVAFKRDIDDARNSPAQRVIELLLKAGAQVTYHDPHVAQFSVGGNVFLKEVEPVKQVALSEKTLSQADCVVIITGHSNLNYPFIAKYSTILVDAVNASKAIQKTYPNIIRL